MTATTKKPRRTKAGTSKASAADRRIAFVEAYFVHNENITEAALAVGFSPKTAHAQGARLLKDVRTQQLLNKRRAELCEKLQITTETVLREVARLALFDPRKLFNADGSPKPITELDDDTAAAIAGLEVVEEFESGEEGRKFVGYTKKYKIADKNSSLDKLMKHLGLFEKDNKQATDLRVTSITRKIVRPDNE